MIHLKWCVTQLELFDGVSEKDGQAELPLPFWKLQLIQAGAEPPPEPDKRTRAAGANGPDRARNCWAKPRSNRGARP